MTQSSKILEDIALESLSLRKEGQKILAVFDLDSTLFDVHPRIEQILRDFADTPEIRQLAPEQAELLSKVQAQRTDWGIRQAIERAGIHTVHPELAQKARRFWVNTFFSNHYLKFDQPYPGSVRYVQYLASLGVEIVYLTGREISKMEIGSLEALRSHAFPLAEDGRELVMKPRTGYEDFQFKLDWFTELPRHQYGRIWFFENEPINLDSICRSHPEVRLVFMNSVHSGRMPSPEGLPTIEDFQVDWQRILGLGDPQS